MKLRILLASVIVAIFILLISLQMNVVNAANYQQSPLTGPVTTPVTYFSISGKVNYIFNGIFSNAANVIISAVNKKTKENFVTLTNTNGEYSLMVKPGLYTVRPSDQLRTHFKPGSKVVDAKTSDAIGINFIGALRK